MRGRDEAKLNHPYFILRPSSAPSIVSGGVGETEVGREEGALFYGPRTISGMAL